MIKSLLFRFDAGDQFGMGHLSRCLALANELAAHLPVKFVIKSDNREKVKSFLEHRIENNIIEVSFIDAGIKQADDLSLLVEEVKRNKSFLILDHYSVNESYQLFLKENNIKWLQFDSHGKMPFYADLVLHGSPGATLNMYEPLRRNPNTEFLLGTDYAIVNKSFLKARQIASVRKSFKKALLCFGGGDDKGATIKTLQMIEKSWFEKIIFDIIVTSSKPPASEIFRFAEKHKNLRVVRERSDIHLLMVQSDFAILTPGTLSYEAATVGLPMLLLTLADNQSINDRGWHEKGAAISLGKIDTLDANIINTSMERLSNINTLQRMSNNCLQAIDGKGLMRVAEIITNKR